MKGVNFDMESLVNVITDIGHVVVTIKKERDFQERKKRFYQRINRMNQEYINKKKGIGV